MKNRALLMFAALTAIFFLFGMAVGQIPLPVIPGTDPTEDPADVPEETPVPEWIQTQQAIQMMQTEIIQTQEAIAVMQTQAVWDITLEAVNAEQTRIAQTQAAFGATQTQAAEPAVTSTPKFSDAQDPTNKASADELFRKGKTYYEKQDYEEAVKWYRLAADQGDELAAQALKEIMRWTVTPTPTLTQTPKPTAVSVKAGNIITFGHYEQDNNLKNGPEPIEWRVLVVEDARALLISKYGLDAKPYHEKDESVTWEKCSLRGWLNEEFYNKAFDSSEKNRILQITIKNLKNQSYGTKGGNDTRDHIFLLSFDEANLYFVSNDDRMCQSSDYAKENGASIDRDNGNSSWWLRSPGWMAISAAFVRPTGNINYSGDYVHRRIIVVRPAFWLDL